VIDARDTCKLCDFGASRVLQQHTTRLTAIGTIAWMSPELIQGLPARETADTWSFGVVLWEMLTRCSHKLSLFSNLTGILSVQTHREVPFSGMESFRIAWAVVENSHRLCIPAECPDTIKNFLNRCWEKEAKQRPLFPEILSQLKVTKHKQHSSFN